MTITIPRPSWAVPLLALAACGQSPVRSDAPATDHGDAPVTATATLISPANDAAPAAAAPTVAATVIPAAMASAAAASPLSCAADIGAAAAARRVAVCRNVSPATHPPCNAANSCALIEDEIARSCALFDGKGPPMKGCGPAPTSGVAAADVVRRYYSAINARDYATAWQQWGDDGRPGQTYASFEKGFADTRATRVTIGALGPSEGGAGSIYQAVPVSIDATLADGTHQRFTGRYVVRRVNGVDGATADQLRWHLDSAQLRRATAG